MEEETPSSNIRSRPTRERESMSILVRLSRILRSVYPSRLSAAFDGRFINIGPFRDACLPVGMTDKAAFLRVLASTMISVSCGPAKSHNIHQEPYEAMMYHAQAVKLVNSSIRHTKYNTSDGFISAIIEFGFYHVRYFLLLSRNTSCC